jgi:hypothetical protein
MIQQAITTILDRAMSDSSYVFPSISSITSGLALMSMAGAGGGANESSTSLGMGLQHQKSYSASISSIPSRMAGGAVADGQGQQGGMALLDEMGMRGLGDMGFAVGKSER